MTDKDNSSTQTYFIQQYNELLNSISRDSSEIIIAYHGDLSADMVNALAYKMEKQLQKSGEKKGIIKRLFSIIIEILQNIRIHGGKDKDNFQDSFILLAKNPDHYMLKTANLVPNGSVQKITSQIENINRLNQEELKKYYMTTLAEGEISVKGGAGLGFITIAMKSKNKIAHRFVKLSDHLNYFEMESLIRTN